MANIRYHGLTFKNGYAYRECKINLDQQGLVLIRGLNLDDGGFLGAGKTSPFEVFSLLQTGRVGKQRKGERMLADDVINLSVGTGFEARLRFDVDGHPYEIVQCRKHPRHGNKYLIIDVNTGQDILPNANRKKPQNWVLPEVLGMDGQSFFNLVYMAQDFSNVMLHGTDGDRQQNLIQMFGLDVYDQLQKRTKQKLSALQTTARDVVQLKEELDDLVTELKQYRETPDQVLVQLEIKRQEQQNLQLQHDTALDQQDDLQDRLQALEMRRRYVREVKNLWGTLDRTPVDSIGDVDIPLQQSLKTKIDSTNDTLLDLRNSIRLLDQRHIMEQRLATLASCDQDETQQQLNDTRDDLRRLTNKDLPRAEQRLEIVQDIRKLQKPNRTAQQAREELEAAKDQRHDVEREIEIIKSALEHDVCPTCGRAYEEDDSTCSAQDYEQKLKRLQTKLTRHAGDVHDLAAELKNADGYEQLKTRLTKIGASCTPTDVQKNIGRLSREERRLVTLLEAENLRETLQRQLETLPTESADRLTSTRKKKERLLTLLQSQHDVVVRVVEKRAKIRRLPKGKVQAIKQRLLQAKKTLRETNAGIIQLSTAIAAQERLHEKLDGLTRRKTKIEVAMQKTEKIQTEVQCLQALEKAFGAKGLKRERFISILADATEQTVPYYSHLLWPKRNTRIALQESNTAVKFELQRGDLTTGSRLLSGGERNKAGLSLLFGMRDLKEKYTGLRTNVLILDEPFGNLDAFGTECLLNVLQDMRNRFGTVLVIGNQRDVLTRDIWDQTWWAVRENNEAHLYQDGLPERYNASVQRYSHQDTGQA